MCNISINVPSLNLLTIYWEHSEKRSLFFCSFSFAFILLLVHVYLFVHLQFFWWSKGRKTGLVLFAKALKREPGELFGFPFMLVSCLATGFQKLTTMACFFWTSRYKLRSSVWRCLAHLKYDWNVWPAS